jgi:glycosyltransferase involved in cell wall biosynthesis
MKVAHISYSDAIGGAPRAAYRIHLAVSRLGIESRMHVVRASTGDWTVETSSSIFGRKTDALRTRLGESLTRMLHTGNQNLHSPAVLPSRWPRLLNRLGADVIHLHWVEYEMMSIADIDKLRAPVVWTLHDMWAFSGAEHYTEDFRWRDGYLRKNRPTYESGFDLNRWTWKRKLKHWRRPMHIVAPSQWLADCASQSAIMRDWPIAVIPNAIDTDAWQPVEKPLARKILNLPADRSFLLVSAVNGAGDRRKGFDLLKAALDRLRGEISDLELVVLGQPPPREAPDFGFPVHFTGHLKDDTTMCLYYSAADAVVVPSRQDNLPNVGVEAQACGTPVVAFRVCGLPDIVDHHTAGYLAKPFDTEDLARGIQWVLDGSERRASLSIQSRRAAVAKFSYPVVAEQYVKLYNSLCRS